MKNLQRSPITFTSCLMLCTLAATAQPTTAPAPDTASTPNVLPADGPALVPAPNPTVIPPTHPTPGNPPITIPPPAPVPINGPGLGQAAPQASPPDGTPTFTGQPHRTGLQPNTPLGEDLRGKVKEDGKQFAEKSAAAKLAFEARQAAERESLATSSKDKGFWESRRLKQELLSTQDKQRREFRAEQEQQRRMYEWRQP